MANITKGAYYYSRYKPHNTIDLYIQISEIKRLFYLRT